MANRLQKLFCSGSPSIVRADIENWSSKTWKREIFGTPPGQPTGTAEASEERKIQEISNSSEGRSIPEEPTNCCMSGCPNCVWVEYAEELIKSFEGGSAIAREVIKDKVQDPNMKAFLDMELRLLEK